jgi:glycosyltransferase involved in cell wall biosynthesis
MQSRTNQLKGAYVVTESGCLDPHTGAYRHIQIGIQELQKYFSIFTIFPDEPNQFLDLSSKRKSRKNTKKDKLNFIRGSLIDLKTLLLNTLRAIRLAVQISKQDLDFVYFRASFLGSLPIFLRFLNIPCFIEANGLQFKARQKYYPSLLVPFNRWLEKLNYTSAKYVFFVGSYGDYWVLSCNNWTNLENGVESGFVSSFSQHQKQLSDEINVIFIARLMAHHRPDILIAAIHLMDAEIRKKLHIHLVGSGLETLKSELSDSVKVSYHGFLDRDHLQSLLSWMHVGLIPAAPEYQSQMKLFDYGSAKCVVVAPRTHNFLHWFDDSTLLFFEPNDPLSLAKALTDLAQNIDHFLDKGHRLHQLISEEFTWEYIFSQKAKVINNSLNLTKVFK